MKWIFVLVVLLLTNTVHAEEKKWGALFVAEESLCIPIAGSHQCSLRERIISGASENTSSPEQAREFAMLKCIATGISGCRIVETFSECGFITNGVRVADRKMRYMIGTDPQKVVDDCIAGGFVCRNPPAGICHK